MVVTPILENLWLTQAAFKRLPMISVICLECLLSLAEIFGKVVNNIEITFIFMGRGESPLLGWHLAAAEYS